MIEEESSIPVVVFKDIASNERFWREGLLRHEGTDYRFWGPVSEDGGLWEAFEKLHAAGKATFIAFNLVPNHRIVTVAYVSSHGDSYSDGLQIQNLVEEITGGTQAA